MAPRFKQGDFVLFDQGVPARAELDYRAPYLVLYDGGLFVRYIRRGGSCLYLVAEDSLRDPIGWDYVSLMDQNILEVVRGRIVWICRQVETFKAE
jgi:hypothetical protein